MPDLHSKARQSLLVYYFTNPAVRHHLRHLADHLSVDPSKLSKEFPLAIPAVSAGIGQHQRTFRHYMSLLLLDTYSCVSYPA